MSHQHTIAGVLRPHLKDPRRPGGKGAMVLAGDLLVQLRREGWTVVEATHRAVLLTAAQAEQLADIFRSVFGEHTVDGYDQFGYDLAGAGLFAVRDEPRAGACPFCRPNWPNLDIVERAMPVGPAGIIAIVRPLNPVVPGHVLVIHGSHDESVAADRESSRRASLLMAVAADYVHVHRLQANIITSVGPAATQTVLHSHVHIVPREPGDGLALPWTGQARPPAWFDPKVYRGCSVELDGEVTIIRAPSGVWWRSDCQYCASQTTERFPRHEASADCQSGRRAHCTCDGCW